MKIHIKTQASCGNILIPMGDYWVSLHPESSQIFLSAGGKDLKIPSTRRRAQSKTKRTQITFFSGGGPIWSLVVNTPNQGEWVSLIEYKK